MTTRSLLRGLGLLLALAVLVPVASRKAKPTPLPLRPGVSLGSRVGTGPAPTFTFELRRDEYILLRVTQEPLDVILTLHPPRGGPWAPLDTQSIVAMPEFLRVAAPADGRYTLEVKAPGKDSTGPFRIEVVERRRATVSDWFAVDAQNRLAEAERFRRGKAPRRALPLYTEAARLFRKAHDAGGEGYARVQWARALESLDRKTEKAAVLREGLALPAATQAPGIRAKAAIMLAEALFDLGNGAEAAEWARESQDQWRRLGKTLAEAQVINDFAHRAVARGELTLAERLYLQALRRFDKDGSASDTKAALVLGNLAAVYNLAGEPQLALDTAERGWARFGHDASPAQRVDILERKGEALARLDRAEESQAAFDQALDLLRTGDPVALAQLEWHLARRAYLRGRFDEAVNRYRSALATFVRTQDRPSAIAVLQDLAWAELKSGNLTEAERLFQRISAEAPENRWLKPAALAGQARLERARGRLEPALELAHQALAEIEELRGELGRVDFKTSVFANQQFYFDLATDLTLELYGRTRDPSRLAEAFEISERSRARRLLDLLATDRPPSTAAPGGVETPAMKALREAERELAALGQNGAEDSAIAEAEKTVRQRLLEQRREQEGGFGGVPLSFSRIQSWIEPDTVLLEFDLGDDASYLWVVSREELKVHRLPPREQVETLARTAIKALSTRANRTLSGQSRDDLLAASGLLLGEAMPELAARRWLVVMDGALHALPLPALPDPRNPEEALFATHEIAYAPSASVAVQLSERERRAGSESRTEPRKELALFADAVYELEKAPAPRPPAKGEDPGFDLFGLLRSDPTAGLSDLPRLRYTEDEARHVLAMVPPGERLDARRFDATKARVLSGELAGYRRLHFAVHGLPDEKHPELSGLGLSLFDRQGRPQDGILFAYEIARLHLPADLAVLSACKSGRGAAVSGEGLVGLAHAFFTAGTSRVVASEWAVHDQATAELMTRFYDGLLRQRLNPARALQQAQRELARSERWNHPYYWGGFVVQGGF